MKDLLITNATVVNEGEEYAADVLAHAGRIERIDADLSAIPARQTLDAKGKHLLPGMIDDQVHFREPGDGSKGTIADESRAAVAGGVTAFMEMPNTDPPTLTIERLREKYARAAGRAYANYAFYFGTANDNLAQLRRLRPNDACGIKIFMGASTGNLLVDDPAALAGFFAQSPLLIATHCEHTPTILQNEQAARARYGAAVPMREHARIRSEAACYKSSALAVQLAREHDTRLHVLHLSTAKELELFAPGPVAAKRITAEACVHHLWFDEADYATKSALIKCNPSIKTATDKAALLQAVRDDVIDVIATDHAPHTWAEKQRDYFNAPSGLPLVQHALLSLLEQVKRGALTLPQVARKTSHAVAECFGVRERGYIREGYFADLALVDMEGRTAVTRDGLYYRCGWSPFQGHVFQARIAATIVNGRMVWDGERISKAPPGGQRLEFAQKF